jgi:hypothetical protein
MRTTFIITALILSLSLIMPGQAPGDELSESYFPLKEGMRWEYRVMSAGGAPQKLIITNLVPRQVNGTEVTPRKWELGGTTFFQLMKKDDSGIYRYAEQAGDKAPPKLITPPECHLKFPLTMGDSWKMTTKVGDRTLNLNLTIESVSDEVKVSAGTFQDCIEVKQVGSNEAGAEVMGYEWYAPKVGVVKSMVTIKKKSKEKAVTEVQSYELVSFKP